MVVVVVVVVAKMVVVAVVMAAMVGDDSGGNDVGGGGDGGSGTVMVTAVAMNQTLPLLETIDREGGVLSKPRHSVLQNGASKGRIKVAGAFHSLRI